MKRWTNYAPINLKPAEGGGRAWGGDLTFFKNLPSNSLPTGKPFQSNAQKFPHPGRHIAVNHSQAGCKKTQGKQENYNFHFSTLLHLQGYYLIKIQSAFNTLCISNYKINRFFKKQFVFSAKAAESITSEKRSHCSNWPVHWSFALAKKSIWFPFIPVYCDTAMSKNVQINKKKTKN